VPGSVVPVPRSSPPRPASRRSATGRSEPLLNPRSFRSRSVPPRGIASWDSRSASFTSSYPAKRLYTDCRSRSAKGKRAFFARESVPQGGMSSPNPSRSSSSRIRIRPPSEVTRDP
jgi:hypothetical protein